MTRILPAAEAVLAPGLRIVGEDDGLSSGRLLLHDLWAAIKASFPGKPLVRVPSRGVVIAYCNVASDMAFADRVKTELRSVV